MLGLKIRYLMDTFLIRDIYLAIRDNRSTCIWKKSGEWKLRINTWNFYGG